MGLLIFFFTISIVFSFLCSIWEAALLSIPPATVEIELQQGTLLGKRLKKFKENIDRPLAAILTLNTIAHTAGAIGVGVQAVQIWGENFTATVMVPVAMTLAILILSEIIPKTLGANFWHQLMGFTVNSVQLIIYILFPLVILSQFITRSLKKDKKKSVLSRSDFSAMAKIGARHGIFRVEESRIIQNLLRFGTIRAKDIMTPRTVVLAADEEMSVKDFFKQHPTLRFSRIPVFQESIDNISGFILKDEMLSCMVHENGEKPLKEIRRPIQIVSELTTVPNLFNQLMERREQIALVVDEFGGMAGLVTIEDVIETLLGMEIIDELDNIEDMQTLARKNWEKRAKTLGLIGDESDQEDQDSGTD